MVHTVNIPLLRSVLLSGTTEHSGTNFCFESWGPGLEYRPGQGYYVLSGFPSAQRVTWVSVVFLSISKHISVGNAEMADLVGRHPHFFKQQSLNTRSWLYRVGFKCKLKPTGPREKPVIWWGPIVYCAVNCTERERRIARIIMENGTEATTALFTVQLLTTWLNLGVFLSFAIQWIN
jgi:hypothetical protein